MSDLRLICPDCKVDLIIKDDNLLCASGHSFKIREAIYELLPNSIDEITKNDAIFHGGQIDGIVEQAQYTALRNYVFHKRITDFISDRSKPGSNIIEIGGGYGYDLGVFLKNDPKFKNYVFSDLSSNVLAYVRKNIKNDKIFYCAIDANNIPLHDGQFNFVYAIAALHHFCDLDRSLKEIIRITKKNGFIIFGIEPNKWWLTFFKNISGIVRKILPKKDHSPSDEEAEGFVRDDFKRMAEKYDLELIKLEHVWFLCGFIHFGLEFIYRVFRLKTRIKLPYVIEMPIVYLDKFISFLPFIKNSCWHYTIIFKKK